MSCLIELVRPTSLEGSGDYSEIQILSGDSSRFFYDIYRGCQAFRAVLAIAQDTTREGLLERFRGGAFLPGTLNFSECG